MSARTAPAFFRLIGYHLNFNSIFNRSGDQGEIVSHGNRMQTFSQLIEPALGSVGQIRDRRRYDPNRLDLVYILATNWTLNLNSKLK